MNNLHKSESKRDVAILMRRAETLTKGTGAKKKNKFNISCVSSSKKADYLSDSEDAECTINDICEELRNHPSYF
jgi:hypothetical protein